MNDAMNTDMFEELVRARAYALWESEGRPSGRDAEHWRVSEDEARAELALASAATTAKTPKPKAAPRKKPAVKSAPLALEMATRH